MTDRAGASTARLVVLAILLLNSPWAVVLAWTQTDPPSPAARVAYASGLLATFIATILVLYAAVTPSVPARSRRLRVGLLLVLTLLMWAPSCAWVEPTGASWAWLAGGVAGLAPLLVSARASAVTLVALTALAGLGAQAYDGPLGTALLTTLGMAAFIFVMCQALVWLLRLLTAAETGQRAEADLAVAQERLRLSRELHDVLGHRLGVIALKAELAGDLATRDALQARQEAYAIKDLAAGTVAEARRAVQGDTVSDLATQLRSAELVLTSAGIETVVKVDPAGLPRERAHLAAVVVREAVTNVLRHSDASLVSMTLEGAPESPILAIMNDGVRDVPSPRVGSGTGLAALAARCAEQGARLRSGPAGDGRFGVWLEIGPGPAKATSG
jgi:two-component system, NarL family, sensor histidine kinase DesK